MRFQSYVPVQFDQSHKEKQQIDNMPDTQNLSLKPNDISQNLDHEKKASKKHSVSSANSLRDEGLWYSFVSSCTLHGLRYVFERDVCRFRRTLWLLIMLGQIVWLAFQTNVQLRRYFSYRVQTKVTLEHERSAIFPAVTLCNFNPFNRSKVKAKSEKLLRYVWTHNGKKMDTNESFWNQFTTSELNMTQEYLNGGFVLDDLMLECRWSGTNCYSKNFTQILTSFGLCYTFNPGRLIF